MRFDPRELEDTPPEGLKGLYNVDMDAFENVIRHTPMGNFGTANDMCGAVRFLLDDTAAGFVTGITVPVDGGFLTLSGV